MVQADIWTKQEEAGDICRAHRQFHFWRKTPRKPLPCSGEVSPNCTPRSHCQLRAETCSCGFGRRACRYLSCSESLFHAITCSFGDACCCFRGCWRQFHVVVCRSGKASRSVSQFWCKFAAAERGEEIRPRAKRPPRTRSSEAPDADAREIERLARRVEQHSQRMAELLRRGVREPSLAYAFLMTKGGQRIPQAKSKARARASSRATTSEGAEAAPDTSPPRLPPERPPMVFTSGETMEPSNAGPEVRTSRRA